MRVGVVLVLKIRNYIMMAPKCAFPCCETAQLHVYHLRTSWLYINVWRIFLYDLFSSLPRLISEIKSPTGHVDVLPVRPSENSLKSRMNSMMNNELKTRSWIISKRLFYIFMFEELLFMYKHSPNLALRVFHQLHFLNQRSPTMLMSTSDDCCALFSKTILDCVHVLCRSSASAIFQNDEDFSLWLVNCWLCSIVQRPAVSQSLHIFTQPTIPRSGVYKLDGCRALFSKSSR
jgi:hypothetical protein